jgi:hypothetical protein
MSNANDANPTPDTTESQTPDIEAHIIRATEAANAEQHELLHPSDPRDIGHTLCSCGAGPYHPRSEQELLHKWVGGQSGYFIDQFERGPLLELLEVIERRRG